MSSDEERFEAQLVELMRRLGQGAGAGPDPQSVLARLQRRTVRRWIGVAAAATVAVIIVCLVGLWPAAEGRRQQADPLAAGDAPELEARRVSTEAPQHIRSGAPPREVESTLRAYLHAAKLRGCLLVDKSPGRRLSYAFVSWQGQVVGDMSPDLEVMFREFETVSIRLRNGQSSCLLATTDKYGNGL